MSAFPWFTRVLNDSNTSRRVLHTEWRNHGSVNLQASIFSNKRGFYLRIVEKLSDQCSFAICTQRAIILWSKAKNYYNMAPSRHRQPPFNLDRNNTKEHSSRINKTQCTLHLGKADISSPQNRPLGKPVRLPPSLQC